MSPNRRPNGTGSVRWRGTGKAGSGPWQLRVFAGTDPSTGKQRQYTQTVYVSGRKDALAELAKFAAEHGADERGPQSNRVVAELLSEWIAHSEARGRAPRTIVAAKAQAAVIVLELGRMQVAKLTPRHIDEFYRKLANGTAKRPTPKRPKQTSIPDGDGRKNNRVPVQPPKQLAPASIRRYHAILSAALSQAVRWGWITRNPAALATLPKLVRAEIEAPSVDEVRLLVGEARKRSLRMGMILALATMTAMRRGELCGLQWGDIGDGMIRVRRSVYRVDGKLGLKAPKSGNERRVAIDPVTFAFLNAWRKQCEAKHGPIPAEAFVVSSPNDPLTPTSPDTVSTFVTKLTRSLDLPKIHLHSLRHFAITHALVGGASVRDVASFAGHADAKLTLNTYSHAVAEQQSMIAASLANVLELGAGEPQ